MNKTVKAPESFQPGAEGQTRERGTKTYYSGRKQQVTGCGLSLFRPARWLTLITGAGTSPPEAGGLPLLPSGAGSVSLQPLGTSSWVQTDEQKPTLSTEHTGHAAQGVAHTGDVRAGKLKSKRQTFQKLVATRSNYHPQGGGTR